MFYSLVYTFSSRRVQYIRFRELFIYARQEANPSEHAKPIMHRTNSFFDRKTHAGRWDAIPKVFFTANFSVKVRMLILRARIIPYKIILSVSAPMIPRKAKIIQLTQWRGANINYTGLLIERKFDANVKRS